MAGGFRTPQDDIGILMGRLSDLAAQVRELARPSGTQTADAVKTLMQLVNDLPGQIYAVLATEVNTGNVNATGNVVAGGAVSAAGVVTGTAGMSSIGVYNNLLTSGYRGMWVKTPTGEYGYVPSSRRFKQDEKAAPSNLEAALAIQVVTFRYIQAVEELGEAAQVEWGVIAEDLHNLGFTWLVDYDDEGLPFGVKKEAIIFAFIPVIQDHEARLRAAGL